MANGKYSDELTLWLNDKNKPRKKPPQNKCIVEFIAAKNDITEAIAAGHTLYSIWEHMKETGKISSGYQTFVKHTKKYLKTENQEKGNQAQEMKSVEKPVMKPSAKIAGFTFNSQPNIKDLV